MTRTILFALSSTDGHTFTIARRMAEQLQQAGTRVTVKPIAEINREDIDECQQLVIGASVRFGKHQQEVTQFVDCYREVLDDKQTALFSVCAVARKPGKDTPATNPYFKKLIKQLEWDPAQSAVFAGRLDFQKYRFWERQMIRFIMWLTNGPTDKNTCIEFTDWKKVDGFANQIAGAAL